MTAIKQVAVTKPEHVKALGNYLNDGRALARASQHIVNEDRWAQEMELTRESYGHNVPSRAGAKNTFLYHQILAFLPEEASCNGGKMTPEKCMEYAAEYVQTRYPNQEAVWALHEEHCASDNTSRYAVHVVLNISDLHSSKRLHEGRSQTAKFERANTIRSMDEKWGLRQLERGMRNSMVHAMQPTRAEQEMAARGVLSQKELVRQKVAKHVMAVSMEAPGGNLLRELHHRLKQDGIRMTVAKNEKQLQFETEDGLKVNGNRLGRGYSMEGIAHGLGMENGLRHEAGLEQGAGV